MSAFANDQFAQDPPVAATPGPVPTESFSEMVEAVEDVAATVQDAALSDDQLRRLRGSTRRLRRAIEMRNITASTLCRGCGEVFVRVDEDAAFCSQECRTAATASESTA
jgi:hypothetical protein